MSRQRKNGLLRVLASRGAGMWAAAMLGILTLLMLVNNFHLIWFHVRQSSYGVKWSSDRGKLSYQSMKQSLGTRFGRQNGNEYEESWHTPLNRVSPSSTESSKQVLVKEGLERLSLTQQESFNWSGLKHAPAPRHPCEGFSLPPPPADKKRTGPRPCPVCYLPVKSAVKAMPTPGSSSSPVLKNLSYVSELKKTLAHSGRGGSDFGGYLSLSDWAKAYEIKESMVVNCGFVKGGQPGVGTGFDISEDDRLAMKRCPGVIVASAIFGNYDELQQPKNISTYAKTHVCFFIFVDEVTGKSILSDKTLQTTKKVGLWRIVVVHNLPYSDARRNGKIPKLLIHRLFPSALFSIWVDGKLELIVDPYQILERFLWRGNDTFAISRHYARFDVFVEAEANKAAGKYSNASIDEQIQFYRSQGMTPYSDAKLPITSDVPEGCVIIREHTTISNLFGCLWFNEVDRFTSRDQLSFAIVRDKIMAQIPWRLNMFLDCERRNFVVQSCHHSWMITLLIRPIIKTFWSISWLQTMCRGSRQVAQVSKELQEVIYDTSILRQNTKRVEVPALRKGGS